MKEMSKDLSKVFFNSVEEMNECYSIDAELPSDLYTDTDLVCYEIVEPFAYEYVAHYKFTKKGFYHLDGYGEPVIPNYNEITLESEVYEDDIFEHEGRCFVYVRVNEYLRKHLEKTLIGCEFVHKYDSPFSSERRFISIICSKSLVVDQYGVFSGLDNIMLYPDDNSDPIHYKEWIKKINEQEAES